MLVAPPRRIRCSSCPGGNTTACRGATGKRKQSTIYNRANWPATRSQTSTPQPRQPKHLRERGWSNATCSNLHRMSRRSAMGHLCVCTLAVLTLQCKFCADKSFAQLCAVTIFRSLCFPWCLERFGHACAYSTSLLSHAACMTLKPTGCTTHPKVASVRSVPG